MAHSNTIAKIILTQWHTAIPLPRLFLPNGTLQYYCQDYSYPMTHCNTIAHFAREIDLVSARNHCSQDEV